MRALALVSLILLGSGCMDEHLAEKSGWFEDAHEENAAPKADSASCSGVVVPDRSGLDRRIALTFDDGPNPATTPQVLATLRAHGVPAAFFINGSRVGSDAARALAREIAEDPAFILANHTWSHRNMKTLGATEAARQIDRATEVIATAGAEPRWFRFPYGASTCATARMARDRGYTVTGWHIDSADWCYAAGGGRCPASTFRYVPDDVRGDMTAWVLRQARRKGGGIVLFHDVHAFTAGELDRIITELKNDGFTFTTIDDAGTFPLLNGVTPPDDFIGDPCQADDDCTFAGAFCMPASRDGSGGHCTSACVSTCPDRGGYATTRCVRVPDGNDAELDLCAVSCGGGCPAGTTCQTYESPTGIARQVCWPE
jgi:peptidoglycan-N-acetylglucosamine deacetylase